MSSLQILESMCNRRQCVLDLNDLVTKLTINGSVKDSIIILSKRFMPRNSIIFLKGGSALTKLRGLPNTGDVDLGVVFNDPQDFTNLLFEKYDNLRTSRHLQLNPRNMCDEFTNFVRSNKISLAKTFLSNIEKLRSFLLQASKNDETYIFKTYEESYFRFTVSKDYIPKLSEIEGMLLSSHILLFLLNFVNFYS